MSPAREQLRQFWDPRYAAPGLAYGTELNHFLMAQVQHLPGGGRVLCLADGEGRRTTA